MVANVAVDTDKLVTYVWLLILVGSSNRGSDEMVW